MFGAESKQHSNSVSILFHCSYYYNLTEKTISFWQTSIGSRSYDLLIRRSMIAREIWLFRIKQSILQISMQMIWKNGPKSSSEVTWNEIVSRLKLGKIRTSIYQQRTTISTNKCQQWHYLKEGNQDKVQTCSLILISML